MKPFRGKPEKPERSNGEIHSRLLLGFTDCGNGDVRVGCSLRFISGFGRVHFSPSRSSRSVGCCSTVSSVARELGFSDVYGHWVSEQLARRFTDGGRPRLSSRPARGKYVNCDGDRT